MKTNKKQINDILIKMQTGEYCIGMASNKLCDIIRDDSRHDNILKEPKTYRRKSYSTKALQFDGIKSNINDIGFMFPSVESIQYVEEKHDGDHVDKIRIKIKNADIYVTVLKGWWIFTDEYRNLDTCPDKVFNQMFELIG